MHVYYYYVITLTEQSSVIKTTTHCQLTFPQKDSLNESFNKCRHIVAFVKFFKNHKALLVPPINFLTDHLINICYLLAHFPLVPGMLKMHKQRRLVKNPFL